MGGGKVRCEAWGCLWKGLRGEGVLEWLDPQMRFDRLGKMHVLLCLVGVSSASLGDPLEDP